MCNAQVIQYSFPNPFSSLPPNPSESLKFKVMTTKTNNMSAITPEILRNAGHSLNRLLEMGHTIEQCKNCDFTCEEFRLLGKKNN